MVAAHARTRQNLADAVQRHRSCRPWGQQQQAAHPAAQRELGALRQAAGGGAGGLEGGSEQWVLACCLPAGGLASTSQHQALLACQRHAANAHSTSTSARSSAHLWQQVVQQAGLPPRLVQPQVESGAVVQGAGAVAGAGPDLLEGQLRGEGQPREVWRRSLRWETVAQAVRNRGAGRTRRNMPVLSVHAQRQHRPHASLQSQAPQREAHHIEVCGCIQAQHGTHTGQQALQPVCRHGRLGNEHSAFADRSLAGRSHTGQRYRPA